jgi:GTPase
MNSKLTARWNGLFKVTVAFGDAALAGDARITVLRKGKRIARAYTPVRRGQTVTKTLKLTKRGLKAIKPGRSKMVTLELRLPGGEKLKKTLKLTRKKR